MRNASEVYRIFVALGFCVGLSYVCFSWKGEEAESTLKKHSMQCELYRGLKQRFKEAGTHYVYVGNTLAMRIR